MGKQVNTRRDFLKAVGLGAVSAALGGCANVSGLLHSERGRPNIIFAIADDWSWPHAGIAGDKVVKTPTFDRVAREGMLFTNAYVSAPSCTPSRGAILTGQYHWRLEEGGNLWSTLPSKFDVYPDILEQAGYHVGFTGKGWGPGDYEAGGRERNPAGPRYENFGDFLKNRPAGAPMCFWFGGYEPHREYEWQSGIKSGMRLEDVEVPGCMPDSEVVRTDMCDYYSEVQRFDRKVGDIVSILEGLVELQNTVVVITSDNGMPFPRCKSNLYDLGTHVPLAVRWPGRVKAGCVVEDFVSSTDLAPTFLEIGGLAPTADMTGKSLLNILMSGKSGRVERNRDKVLTGKERHAWVRWGGIGYPQRAIRTYDYLYIRNFEPERWPAGDPDDRRIYEDGYGDIDAAPAKSYMLEHRDNPEVQRLFKLAFEKRPSEELYDLKKDPQQLNNAAYEPAYSEAKGKLAAALMAELTAANDPRVLGRGEIFDKYPYYGRVGKLRPPLLPGKVR